MNGTTETADTQGGGSGGGSSGREFRQVGGQRSQSFGRVAGIVGEFDRNGLSGSLRNGSVQLVDGALRLAAGVEADESYSLRQSSFIWRWNRENQDLSF